MFIDQTKYDKKLPHELNRRRLEETQRSYYQAAVNDNTRVSHINNVVNKKIAPQIVRMSIEELRMRIMEKEGSRRKMLKSIFDAEKREFDSINNLKQQAFNSQDSRMSRLEEQAVQIRQQTKQDTEIHNKRAYIRQWENNCDELRGAEAAINARACRLQWDLQNYSKKENVNWERKREMCIDSIVVNDYKQFLIDQKQEEARRIEKMLLNKQSLDEQMDEKSRIEGGILAQNLQAEAREREMREYGFLIDRLASDIQLQKNYFNRAELECQIAVEEAKKKAGKEIELFDGQKLIKEIREEQKQAHLKRYEDMCKERDLQLAFCALVYQRNQIKNWEDKMVDKMFIQNVNSRDNQLLQRERDELKKRQEINGSCLQHNLWQEGQKKQAKIDADSTKKDVLKAIYADMALLEKEKLDALIKKLDDQKQYLAYLYMQDDEKDDKSQSIKQEKKDYSNKQKQDLQDDLMRIQQSLGDQAERIKELDSIRFEDNERPTIKQKQWYNI
ncbi:hypothetical protein SS50377_21929 [Spironucleus salmonicida]|uniref:Trichohyalin-plectin-homology domain-containing protein n=1 Tax=Spironucleus salmonicida TaxID=348837 RepID=V6LTF1_9EUKA|nr:hypothetical protein SS50377_21929 [Spironucleus salmonicida]|eukprot:EST46971.1 hypothetical protein SS50377_12923 [Spironucleus salmonicida]